MAETDGRITGLSTQGYPLRRIVKRVNGIHVLSCGHRLPKPADAVHYDLRKSRRCVECGSSKQGAQPVSNSTSDAPVKDDYMNHPTTCAKWVAYDDNHRRFHSENECTCQPANQRVHQQSDLQCVKCGSQMELQHVCEHCGHREANTDQQSDRLARITGIVQTWASADPDAIDDLDALCRIAEVLDVEVEARTYPPVDEKE